jgi:hypothetical protein
MSLVETGIFLTICKVLRHDNMYLRKYHLSCYDFLNYTCTHVILTSINVSKNGTIIMAIIHGASNT